MTKSSDLFRKTEPAGFDYEESGICDACSKHKGMMNPKPGVKIEGESGKCTRNGGLCPARLEKNAPAVVEIVPDGELEPSERARLAELERIVGKYLLHFVRAGMALTEIRDTRLYRETHDTFESYCRERWDMARSTAYDHIDCAAVARRIEMSKDFGQIMRLPANEAQVRPLIRIKTDGDQVEVWKRAAANAPAGKVTARIVTAEVRKYFGDQLTQKTQRVQNEIDHDFGLPPIFKDLYWRMANEIRDALKKRLREKEREALLRHLDGLRNLLAE